jgi:hypothetical protein
MSLTSEMDMGRCIGTMVVTTRDNGKMEYKTGRAKLTCRGRGSRRASSRIIYW